MSANNDVAMIMTIVSVFVLIGIILPFVNGAFEQTDQGSYDVDGLQRDAGQTSFGITGLLQILGSVFSMFFWTFGQLPVFIDVIFVLFRIELAILILRNVWVGGGG